METASVESLCNLPARSKLLSAGEVRTLRQRWQREGGAAAGDSAAFCKWLVRSRYPTDYQAGMLSRGHADRFFPGEYKLLERLGVGRMAGVAREKSREDFVVLAGPVCLNGQQSIRRQIAGEVRT
jgi:hypothetical protein